MNKWQHMEESLQTLKDNKLYRKINVISSPQNSHVTINKKQMLMLSSNDYLDFCNNNQIKSYAIDILKKYGTGSGGSRLTTGTMDIHVALEKELAHFKNREAALVFNSGFTTNLGVISSICHEGDVIFSDELNHASIIDGCRQSRAKVIIYKHNDMKDLEKKIKNTHYINGLIVSDAVFSMNGDIVDLPKLITLAEKYNLFSMIDEAHATGVIGVTGKGTEEYYNMEGKTDIIMGTLSKTFGSEGGYVCGSQLLINYLKNNARSFIFSTSLSPVTVATAFKAVKLLEEDSTRVIDLQRNINYFCNCLRLDGLDVYSKTAIIPIFIGDEDKALQVSNSLKDQGYFIPAIRYPTVKRGEAILRVTLMSSHTKKELKRASKAIAYAVNSQ